MAYSPTAIYDENNLMIKDGLSTEDVKKTLSGLADGSLEIGQNGIRPKAAVDPEVVKTFANNKQGRKAKKDYKRALREQARSGYMSDGDVQSNANNTAGAAQENIIENKKSSQPSTETEASPTAPNGVIENKLIIPQKNEKSTGKAKKVDRKSLEDGEGVDIDTAQEAREGSQTDESVESEQESVSKAQEAAEAEIDSENEVKTDEQEPKMSERERRRGYSDKEADEARSILDITKRNQREAKIKNPIKMLSIGITM